jgi:hypothetical protein
MTSDYNFQKAREAWGDGVVAPTHRVFQEWLNNPLTKALKQSHKTEIENHRVEFEKLKAMLNEAMWNYGELKRKEWVGLTEDEIEQGQKESWVDKQAFESAVWWAEAKLKEKNR